MQNINNPITFQKFNLQDSYLLVTIMHPTKVFFGREYKPARFLTCSADQSLGLSSFPTRTYPRNPNIAVEEDGSSSIWATLDECRSQYSSESCHFALSNSSASIENLLRMLSFDVSSELSIFTSTCRFFLIRIHKAEIAKIQFSENHNLMILHTFLL